MAVLFEMIIYFYGSSRPYVLLHATVSFNKVIYILHNNSFCNPFGANVYSHPVRVKIIKLL